MIMLMLVLIAVVNILWEFDSCMIVCELLSSGNYLYALWLNCLDSDALFVPSAIMLLQSKRML